MTILNLGRDTSGRDLRLDDTTHQRIRWAENRLGIKLVIVQGSYVEGTEASAGTHDGGGVGDVRSRDFSHEVKRKVLTALREAGLIAWLRTPAQGFDEHIHFVELASKTLAPSAARQVTAYFAGRNGLKDNDPDDGPDVEIPTALPTDVQEDDMSQYEDQLNELLTLAKRTDARVLTTQGAVEKIHGLVRDVAKAIPNMSRWLGYLMKGVEGQGASLTALAAQVDAALASTSDPALVAQLEQIRTELDDVIKAAS